MIRLAAAHSDRQKLQHGELASRQSNRGAACRVRRPGASQFECRPRPGHGRPGQRLRERVVAAVDAALDDLRSIIEQSIHVRGGGEIDRCHARCARIQGHPHDHDVAVCRQLDAFDRLGRVYRESVPVYEARARGGRASGGHSVRGGHCLRFARILLGIEPVAEALVNGGCRTVGVGHDEGLILLIAVHTGRKQFQRREITRGQRHGVVTRAIRRTGTAELERRSRPHQ